MSDLDDNQLIPIGEGAGEYGDDTWTAIEEQLELLRMYGTTDPLKVAKRKRLLEIRDQRTQSKERRFADFLSGENEMSLDIIGDIKLLECYVFFNPSKKKFYCSEMFDILSSIHRGRTGYEFPIQTAHGFGNHLKKSMRFYNKSTFGMSLGIAYNANSRRNTYVITFKLENAHYEEEENGEVNDSTGS